MLKILELIGLNNANEITIVSGGVGDGERHYLVENTISILNDINKSHFAIQKLLLGGQRNTPVEAPIPDIIVNSINDSIGSSRSLFDAVTVLKNANRPVINAPQYVENTKKKNFYRLLENINDVSVPETLILIPNRLSDVFDLIETGAVKIPFIFEESGKRDKKSVLIDSIDVLSKLECFAFDGREFTIRAFVDYKSRDGLYRKYRYFMIGDNLFPGHMIISNYWKIVDDQQTDDLFSEKSFTLKEEEKKFLTTDGLAYKKTFDLIAKKIGLDYFSIDCSFTENGKMLIFDVSTANHYFSKDKNFDYYNLGVIKKMVEAIEWMMIEKLQREQSDV